MAAKLNYTAVILVIVLAVAGFGPFTTLALSERSESNGQNPDTLNALLVEVKGLRAAMEQLASAGPRVQLLFGRLQLQEQRINEQVKRLEAVRAKLKTVQEEDAQTRAQVQRYEDFLRNNPSSPERPDLERDLPFLRKSLGAYTADIVRLQSEEAAMMSEISTEQNRWNDINRALDELDRALARR